MDRAAMNALVMATPLRAFREELEFQLWGVDGREYAYDPVFALFDIEERNEGADGNRTLLREARRLLIAIGFYRPMTEADIRNTWVSRGTKWAFKMDGTPYEAVAPAETWCNPTAEDAAPWEHAA
jgi:hypothetical protein